MPLWRVQRQLYFHVTFCPLAVDIEVPQASCCAASWLPLLLTASLWVLLRWSRRHYCSSCIVTWCWPKPPASRNSVRHSRFVFVLSSRLGTYSQTELRFIVLDVVQRLGQGLPTLLWAAHVKISVTRIPNPHPFPNRYAVHIVCVLFLRPTFQNLTPFVFLQGFIDWDELFVMDPGTSWFFMSEDGNRMACSNVTF
jgi:hypothetical protein